MLANIPDDDADDDAEDDEEDEEDDSAGGRCWLGTTAFVVVAPDDNADSLIRPFLSLLSILLFLSLLSLLLFLSSLTSRVELAKVEARRWGGRGGGGEEEEEDEGGILG